MLFANRFLQCWHLRASIPLLAEGLFDRPTTQAGHARPFQFSARGPFDRATNGWTERTRWNARDGVQATRDGVQSVESPERVVAAAGPRAEELGLPFDLLLRLVPVPCAVSNTNSLKLERAHSARNAHSNGLTFVLRVEVGGAQRRGF